MMKHLHDDFFVCGAAVQFYAQKGAQDDHNPLKQYLWIMRERERDVSAVSLSLSLFMICGLWRGAQ